MRNTNEEESVPKGCRKETTLQDWPPNLQDAVRVVAAGMRRRLEKNQKIRQRGAECIHTVITPPEVMI